MTLRTRTILTVSATAFILMLGIVAAIGALMRSQILRLERESVLEEAGHVEATLADRLDSLKAINEGWSAWDEMHAFARGADPGFPERVLGVLPQELRRVDLLVVFDAANRVRLFGQRQGERFALGAAGADLEALATAPERGLLRWRGQVLLYAAQPIRRSNSGGPVAGRVGFGRFLGASVLPELERAMDLPFELRQPDAVRGTERHAVQVLSEKEVAGLVALRDGGGRTLGWLGFRAPRTLYADGWRMIWTLVAAGLLALVVFVAVCTLAIERGLLRRLERLTREVASFGSRAGGTHAVTVDATDEIGELALGFNASLELLSQARQGAERDALEWRGLLDRLSDVVIEVDAGFRIVSLNAAWERVMGVPVADCLGRDYFDFVHPDAREAVLAGVDALAAPGRQFTAFEHRVVRPDGEVRWMAVRGSVVWDEATRLQGASGVLTDITEQQRSEEAVRRTTARYEALLRYGDDTVYLVDREGRIQYASPNFGHTFGRDASILTIGETSIFALVHPDDLARARDWLAALAAQPDAAMAMEARINPAVGQDQCYEVWGRNLEHDDSVGAILINTRDITGRKRNERALQESERRLRLHLERAPVAVIEWDTRLRVTAWNAEAERTFGYAASEVMGRALAPLLGTRTESQEPEGIIRELVFSARANASVNPNRRKDGQVISVEWTNTPITDERGELVSVISLARDVTAERDAQRSVLESRNQYRNLVEAINGVVWEYIEGQGFAYMSPNVEDFLGHSVAEWFSLPDLWRRSLHPDDAPRVLEHFEDSMRRVSEGLLSHLTYEIEYRFVAKRGHTVWVRELVTVSHTEEGQLRRGGVMFNITAQKLTELELAESEERYALAVRGANDGIWDWDLQRDSLYVSDRCHEILGYQPGELGDRLDVNAFYALVHPDDLARRDDVALVPQILVVARDVEPVAQQWQARILHARLQHGSLGDADELLLLPRRAPQLGQLRLEPLVGLVWRAELIESRTGISGVGDLGQHRGDIRRRLR